MLTITAIIQLSKLHLDLLGEPAMLTCYSQIDLHDFSRLREGRNNFAGKPMNPASKDVRGAIAGIWRLGAIFLVLFLLHIPRSRADDCKSDPSYGNICVAQVHFQQFAQTAYQTQQLDEWCWAASIAMIWAFYGYEVQQSQIVDSVYGNVVDFPAQTTQQLLQVLNGQYTDDAGVQFVSRVTGLYDSSSGIDTISYASLGAALSANTPIMIGIQNLDGSGHAVVLTAIEYYVIPGEEGVDPTGVNILSAGVFDPWPGNGARPLNLPQDLTPTSAGGNLEFAATIRISAASTAGADTKTTSGGVGALEPLFLLPALLLAGCRFYSLTKTNGAAPPPGTPVSINRHGDALDGEVAAAIAGYLDNDSRCPEKVGDTIVLPFIPYDLKLHTR